MRFRTLPWTAVLSLALAEGAAAATIWNEATDGDLSSTNSAPTALAVAVGTNSVAGSVTGGERDYFRITIPAGATLSEIRLAAYGANNLGFFAIQSGTQITVNPLAPSDAAASSMSLVRRRASSSSRPSRKCMTSCTVLA